MSTPTKAVLEQELADRDATIDEACEILEDEELSASEKLSQLDAVLFDEE